MLSNIIYFEYFSIYLYICIKNDYIILIYITKFINQGKTENITSYYLTKMYLFSLIFLYNVSYLK